MYIGVNGVAKKVTKQYIGVNGAARKVKKIYIGDSTGKARLCWSATSSTSITILAYECTRMDYIDALGPDPTEYDFSSSDWNSLAIEYPDYIADPSANSGDVLWAPTGEYIYADPYSDITVTGADPLINNHIYYTFIS